MNNNTMKVDGKQEQNGGRKPIWETPEALWAECQAYFDEWEGKGVPLTMERLAIKLDVDRGTLLNYSKNERFFGVIQKAKDYIVASCTERLNEKGSNVVGSIFYLKNRADFVDKREIDLNADISLVTLADADDEDLDETDD